MRDMDELVALFHSMDKEAQEFTLATARSQARLFPARRPSLRLVAGQLGSAPLRSILGGSHDADLPPVG
jgi:phage I-like protein